MSADGRASVRLPDVRGSLRVYLGVAPGAGATFAMLDEGRRRRDRGTDVVIGAVDARGRRATMDAQGGIESCHPSAPEVLDLGAVIARGPDLALVDDLAHRNPPDDAHQWRWQCVDALLDAGIDVVATVEIRQIESLRDVVESITGRPVADFVPDAFVRSAEQVHLVDQTPEALRRRLAHGNIYPPDTLDAVAGELFRPEVLAGLRELALLWVAGDVDDRLRREREAGGTGDSWETRERVVVAMTGAPTGDALIRRAARLASRSRGELIGVHVRSGEPPLDASGLDRQRRLLASLGGAFREAAGADVAEVLVRTARTVDATQLVLGASARGRWAQAIHGSVINDVVARSGGIDVLVVSATSDPSETVGPVRHPAPGGIAAARPVTFGRRRVVWSWVLATVAPILATVGLASGGAALDRSTHLLAFTLLVAVVALVGGFLPAAVAAVCSFALANWFLTSPTHTWGVAEPEDFVSLVVFVGVAAIIGFYVSVAARRSIESLHARSQAETLAAMAGAMGARSPLAALAEQVRAAFDARAVAVLRREGAGGWVTLAAVGESPPPEPVTAAVSAPLGDDAELAIDGADRRKLDPEVFAAFCSNLGVAIERDRLDAEAARGARLAEAERLRSGLLGAVSHDLRTPLAAIKASSSALLSSTAWDEEIRDELVTGIDQQVDRLSAMVENLLTMSRIQAGAVVLRLEPSDIAYAVSAGLAWIDRRGHEIDVRLGDLPLVEADPSLLERVMGNLLDNACKWSPPGAEVVVDAAVAGDSVVVRVVDRGPGIAPGSREDAFRPFQRVGDRSGPKGTGLGLAIAQGFVTAMGAGLRIEDTVGGGTTMVVTLRVA